MDKISDGKIWAHVERNKWYIHWNTTEAYYKQLRAAYTDIINNLESEYSLFAFISLCSATLEFSLNFILTTFCLNTYGPEDYKSYAEAYIGLAFGKKLLITPSVVTKGQVTFDESSTTYKNLLELIRIRNKLLHGKEFLIEVPAPDLTKSEIEWEIAFGENIIYNLNRDTCLTIGKSLGEFKDSIMRPLLNSEEITPNAFLRKI